VRRPFVIAIAVWVACGGGEPVAGPAQEAVYESSAGERLVVARVDGEPIYGDCVATQAAALGIDRRAALEQCIDFELLAQEARRRGFLSHPQVITTSRREAVRALLDADYPLRTPADIPRADIQPFWDRRIRFAYNHPELRTAVWCRVSTTAADPPERKARAAEIATEVHAALRGEETLNEDVLVRVCADFGARHAGEKFEIAHSRYRSDRQALNPVFGKVLFELPAVNALSKPVLTEWGWDIILLAVLEPPSARSLDDVLAEVQQQVFDRPELEWYREQKFTKWLEPLITRARIEVHPERIPESRF
jgi:hypothetical protein